MTEKSNKNGFTMISDYLLWKYDDLVLAAVYGKIERFTKMGGNIYCKATNQTIADELSITEKTVRNKKDILLEEGYLMDTSKKILKNKPHTLITTDKLEIEEQEFWEYAEEKRRIQKEGGEAISSYYDCFREYAIENEIEPFYSKSQTVTNPSETVTNPSETVTNPSETVTVTDDNTNDTNETPETIYQEDFKKLNLLGELDSLFSEDIPTLEGINNLSTLESTSAASDGKPSSQQLSLSNSSFEDTENSLGTALNIRNLEDCLFPEQIIPPASREEELFLSQWEENSWPDESLQTWFRKMTNFIRIERGSHQSIQECIDFYGKIYFPAYFCEDTSPLEFIPVEEFEFEDFS